MELPKVLYRDVGATQRKACLVAKSLGLVAWNVLGGRVADVLELPFLSIYTVTVTSV